MQKLFLIFIVLLAFSGQVFADVDYSRWDNLLKQYVNSEGFVDYKKLKEKRMPLDVFVSILAIEDISQYTYEEEIAFWINAYNAITVQSIIDNYPVKSIRDIRRIWNVKKKVARSFYSLGEIEHEILRPKGDPRFHFALNCASKGCPKLPQYAFDPKKIDAQLELETFRFIKDKEKVYIDGKKGILFLSSIFKWYRKDFLSVSEDLTSYVSDYLTQEDQDFLEKNKVKQKFLKYDWGLNEQ